MKAAVLHEVNKPLVIEDVSLPNPGPREVLIRTAVAGLFGASEWESNAARIDGGVAESG